MKKMLILMSALAVDGATAMGNDSATVGSATQAPFTLIELTYAKDALAPVMSSKTIDLHWGKHLRGYVNNLNNLIVGTPFESADLVTICKEADGVIFNNAGQIYNHNLYFTSFTPKPSRMTPDGDLAGAIIAKFGTFDNFKKEFVKAGVTLFGSGWVYLSQDEIGELVITQEVNGSTPLKRGYNPLLGFDVWEHAYYVDYENRREEALNNLWDIIDWPAVEARYEI